MQVISPMKQSVRGRVLLFQAGQGLSPVFSNGIGSVSRADENTKSNAVWLFDGKEWDPTAGEELGNYDMGCDVDVSSPGIMRLRSLAAGKNEIHGRRRPAFGCCCHIGSDFFARWPPNLREATGKLLPL